MIAFVEVERGKYLERPNITERKGYLIRNIPLPSLVVCGLVSCVGKRSDGVHLKDITTSTHVTVLNE